MVDFPLLNTFSSPLCIMYVKEQCPYFGALLSITTSQIPETGLSVVGSPAPLFLIVNLSNANIVKLKLLMFSVFN